MEDRLIEILESQGCPVLRQGSLGDNDYPETLITFWNDASDGHSFYDNTEYGVVWAYSVYVYSSDPLKIYSVMEDLIKRFKTNKWIVKGHGYDVPSDVETHTGRGIHVFCLKMEEN